jgi:hypothetical protein
MLRGVRWLWILFVVLIGCDAPQSFSSQRPQLDLNPGWAEIPSYRGTLQAPLLRPHADIHILEGDPSLISGDAPDFGLVLSQQRNDLAAITTRYTKEAADFPGTLIVFTQFDDQASPAPAYFVPIYNDTTGTGMDLIDRREMFGVTRLEGFINMRRLDDHGDKLLPRLLHEVAHRHLAYMKTQVPNSTTSLDLTGREGGHWNAAFNSQGSLLEGYEWRESGIGRFVSVAKQDRLAPIDWYGLGLIDAQALDRLFFISDARVASGARLPDAADIPIGTVVTGTRTDFTGDDLVAALGPRPFTPELRVAFLLLTAPGETASSTTVLATADRIDALRLELEQSWIAQTEGRGTLRTTTNEAHNTLDATRKPSPKAPTNGHGNCGCGLTAKHQTAGVFEVIGLFMWMRFQRKRRSLLK